MTSPSIQQLTDILTPDTRLTQFEKEAKAAFAMASWLRRVVLDRSLPDHEIAWFAKETAHHCRRILAVTQHSCARDRQPLFAPIEKLTGYCNACLSEFEARR